MSTVTITATVTVTVPVDERVERPSGAAERAEVVLEHMLEQGRSLRAVGYYTVSDPAEGLAPEATEVHVASVTSARVVDGEGREVVCDGFPHFRNAVDNG